MKNKAYFFINKELNDHENHEFISQLYVTFLNNVLCYFKQESDRIKIKLFLK